MLSEPRKLHQEDINELCLHIHDWLQTTPLANTEEGYDWLYQLVDNFLYPYNHGYRNFN